jgi:hypothetical protein
MFRKALVGFVVIASVVSALALSGGALAAKGGNSANAKLCQKGGWQNLMDANGAAFTNQDQCVGYGAGGGAIYALAQIEVTATDPQPAPDGFSVSTSGFGLEPTTLVTTTILKNDSLEKFESLFVDAKGEVNGSPFGTFGPCVNGDQWSASATGTSADSLSKPTAPGITVTSNTVTRSVSCP